MEFVIIYLLVNVLIGAAACFFGKKLFYVMLGLLVFLGVFNIALSSTDGSALSFVIAVILAVVAYYFIFPKLSVEYEYIILNHDLQIDAIYNKSKRKRLQSLDIQGAEIIAPKGSPRLNSYKPDKTYDYTSGDPNGKVYAIMIPMDQKNICICIEPDAKMIEHMSQWMGMKMFKD